MNIENLINIENLTLNNLGNQENEMSSEELVLLFKNALSFNDIDESRYNFQNKSLQEQFMTVWCYYNNIFYYDNCINDYTLNLGINNLFIDCRTLNMNCLAFGTGCEDRIKKENLIKPNNHLLEGNSIYDLKIKGDSIKDVNIIILSDFEYTIPFEKINNEWILTTFTKSKPFLFSSIEWVKFYIQVITDKESNITYSYSTLIHPNYLNKKISWGKWELDNIKYERGYIKISKI